MAMTKVHIRPLQSNDFPSWLPLWDQNNMGHRDEAVTAETWSRLMDADMQVHGICAVKGGRMAGLIHYILHPTTGAIEPVCYMQDVFVDPDFRQKGIARQMIEALSKTGQQKKWARMYWLAEADNNAAQALYKTIGVKMNFTLHILPLKPI